MGVSFIYFQRTGLSPQQNFLSDVKQGLVDEGGGGGVSYWFKVNFPCQLIIEADQEISFIPVFKCQDY